MYVWCRGPCKRFQLRPSRKEGRKFWHLECPLVLFDYLFFVHTSRSYRRRLIKGQRFCPRVNHWLLSFSLPFALCILLTPAERLNFRYLGIWKLFVAQKTKKPGYFIRNCFYLEVWGESWSPPEEEQFRRFPILATGQQLEATIAVVSGGCGCKAFVGILRRFGSEDIGSTRRLSLHSHQSHLVFRAQWHDWPILNGAVIICRGLHSS